MAGQVVLSRLQNRRGTQAQFDALYVSGAPADQKLQPGEIGFCTDTHRMFIGGATVGTFTEVTTKGQNIVTGDSLQFIPIDAVLVPASTWTPVLSLSFTISTSIEVLNILYSLIETGSAQTPFSKNGTLTVTSTTSSVSIPSDVQASLSDVGTEINLHADPKPDVSFRAIYSGGAVSIQYKHTFSANLLLRTSTVHWVNF